MKSKQLTWLLRPFSVLSCSLKEKQNSCDNYNYNFQIPLLALLHIILIFPRLNSHVLHSASHKKIVESIASEILCPHIFIVTAPEISSPFLRVLRRDKRALGCSRRRVKELLRRLVSKRKEAYRGLRRALYECPGPIHTFVSRIKRSFVSSHPPIPIVFRLGPRLIRGSARVHRAWTHTKPAVNRSRGAAGISSCLWRSRPLSCRARSLSHYYNNCQRRDIAEPFRVFRSGLAERKSAVWEENSIWWSLKAIIANGD